ncbi:ATP-dependent translocase ABCB1-like [Clavelina lepadiformis]|uniref:ATP-dependent translocase ABCB1-like n=1 Tax=Clavelina lepadiformis TaxID=159417 RepID=UPI0040435094
MMKSKTKAEDKSDLKAAKENEPATISYFELYRYAEGREKALIAVGTLAALAQGVALPLLAVFMGGLINQLIDPGSSNLTSTNISGQAASFDETIFSTIYNFVYVAIGVFFASTIQTTCWTRQVISQSARISVRYFRAILRQDISYHDLASAGELNTRMTENLSKIREGMGEKVGLAIQHTSTIIGSLIVAFVYSYQITLVNLAFTPLLGLTIVALFKLDSIYSNKELDAYSSAGAIAEQTIAAIRTVTAFGCQGRQLSKYEGNLDEAKSVGFKRGSFNGLALGAVPLVYFSMFGVCYWYGTTLVVNNGVPAGNFILAFFATTNVAQSIGVVLSVFSNITAAKVSGARIFHVIDRKPSIDVFSEDGKVPEDINSSVELRNVTFSYPSRPANQVLKNVSLSVEPSKTLALVGQSGSGKSTVVQLIERFYDPQLGSIEIGSHDITSLNVPWLRSQIGLVSQEPVLFATTIGENIRWGRDGVTDKEIEEAARKANAFDFIMKLPSKFDTIVGEKGNQMSGGQKQRIAIARAIVRNPKILLLDEATSALDAKSEALVQEALEKAAAGRTTIVIAHRLSTIRGADKIVAFNQGEVMEEGTHEELMEIENGIYRKLVETQSTETYYIPSESENSTDTDSSTESLHKDESFLENDVEVDVITVSGSVEKQYQRQTSKKKKKRRNRKMIKRKVSKNDDEIFPEIPFSQVLSYNKPEWCYIFFGCIFGLLAGATDPLLSLPFGEVLNNLAGPLAPEEKIDRAVFLGLMFFTLAVGAFLSKTIQGVLFAKSGTELTARLRKSAFRALMGQEIGYFDDPKHTTGILCNRLATDASKVQGSTGIRLGIIMQGIGAIGTGLGIAFYYSWELTLLLLVVIPLVITTGLIQTRLVRTGTAENESQAGSITSQAISNIKTVASLGKEKRILEIYEDIVFKSQRNEEKKAIFFGLALSLTAILPFVITPSVFRLGIVLIENGRIEFDSIFRVMVAVIFGARSLGVASSYVPDYAEAKLAANRTIALIKRKPTVDIYSDDGAKPEHCKGEVMFKSVAFHYPARPDHPVLKEVNLSVKCGQTLALVGQSGSGKSTIVQLLERFYDVENGNLCIDGVDVKDLNLSWLRQQIGLVSQEPVLFDNTIKENIHCGDTDRHVTDGEMFDAAAAANIQNFIEGLPKKYETDVGGDGSQLSGGQKQRIAIARALVRNPKILLLDEATSALDTESEKIVQDALDAARKGRTSIVIAHRLSTIKNADQIAVIENGEVIEVGAHDDLLAKQSAYYRLFKAQMSA